MQGVYRVFSWFLVFEVPTMILSLGSYRWWNIDYRLFWLATRLPYWLLYVWMVYAQVRAVMHEYPGISRLSARVLNGSIAAAALVGGIMTARALYLLGLDGDPWVRAFAAATLLERTASLTSLILLLGVLGFLVWFPVAVPRNLVVFSTIYIVFFASNVVSYSFYGSHYEALVWSVLVLGCICYTCWLLFLTKAGEQAPASIGHSWNPADRDRLLEQLGAINATLVSARGPQAGSS